MNNKKTAHPCHVFACKHESRDKDIVSETVITHVLTPASAGVSGE